MNKQNILVILINKILALLGYRLVKKGYIKTPEEYFWQGCQPVKDHMADSFEYCSKAIYKKGRKPND